MLICRHQTILRLLSSAATASTRLWVRELNCLTTYVSSLFYNKLQKPNDQGLGVTFFTFSYLRSILLTSVEKNLHLPSADDSTARLFNATSNSFKSSGKWSGSFTSSLGDGLSFSSTSWLSSESVVISEPSKKYQTIITYYVRGTQIPSTRLPGWQNLIQRCLIFVGLQNRTCLLNKERPT